MSQSTFTTSSSVTATLCPLAQRLTALPRHFGTKGCRFESLVYSWMRTLCPEYNGGFWEFYELSNGGFYMAPAAAQQESYLLQCNGNGFSQHVSSNSAGIVACIFALSHMGLYDNCQKLLDFAEDLPEAEEIFAAID